MLRLLTLVPLTMLALVTTAQAQSQAGGLPDVSARVQVLETQAKTLETRVTTLQTQAQALETRVTTLQAASQALETRVTTLQTGARALETRVSTVESMNAAVQTALIKEQVDRQKGDADAQAALVKEQFDRQKGDADTQAAAQAALVKEQFDRQKADTEIQASVAKETFERKTADASLTADLDVVSNAVAGISSAQFETVGAGTNATNEFGLVLREIVGPGSWVAIAVISNLRGDVLNGSPAFRACELRTGAGAVLGGAVGTNHDADGVALTVNGGLFVPSGAGEIALWCRVTNSLGGAAWDSAQMVTFKVAAFRED